MDNEAKDYQEFFDDTRTLTLSEIKKIKTLLRQVDSNSETINDLVCLSKNVQAAKRTWTILLGLAALLGGALTWIGIDTIANFFGFRKIP